jgi:hypothetical protein
VARKKLCHGQVPSENICVMARLDRATQQPRVCAANKFCARANARALDPPLEFTLGPREARTRARGDDTFLFYPLSSASPAAAMPSR